MRSVTFKSCLALSATAGLALGSPSATARTPLSAENGLPSCEAANVSLHDLAINARGEGVRSFYEGAALVMAIDQVEPAAASAGLVILLFDPQSEMGDRNCFAITNFNGLDLDGATSSYSPATGVTLRIPATDYDGETGTSKPGRPLVLEINAATGKVIARR
ncbi:MAG: hypothetical protein AAGK01_03425 [Pseudomonadota bacterium]